jgi:hypothetical protein
VGVHAHYVSIVSSTKALRTSQNAVNAKFAESSFHALR